MVKVKIYSTRYCPYCVSAKRLLAQKNVDYEDIDVTGDPNARQIMTGLAGGRTSVPQIWIGNHHVGGSDELHAADASGELDRLLAG